MGKCLHPDCQEYIPCLNPISEIPDVPLAQPLIPSSSTGGNNLSNLTNLPFLIRLTRCLARERLHKRRRGVQRTPRGCWIVSGGAGVIGVCSYADSRRMTCWTASFSSHWSRPSGSSVDVACGNGGNSSVNERGDNARRMEKPCGGPAVPPPHGRLSCDGE